MSFHNDALADKFLADNHFASFMELHETKPEGWENSLIELEKESQIFFRKILEAKPQTRQELKELLESLGLNPEQVEEVLAP